MACERGCPLFGTLLFLNLVGLIGAFGIAAILMYNADYPSWAEYFEDGAVIVAIMITISGTVCFLWNAIDIWMLLAPCVSDKTGKPCLENCHNKLRTDLANVEPIKTPGTFQRLVNPTAGQHKV